MINEDNWLSLVIEYLKILKQVYEDEVMPTMIDDSNHEDKVENIEKLIRYLNKTN